MSLLAVWSVTVQADPSALAKCLDALKTATIDAVPAAGPGAGAGPGPEPEPESEPEPEPQPQPQPQLQPQPARTRGGDVAGAASPSRGSGTAASWKPTPLTTPRLRELERSSPAVVARQQVRRRKSGAARQRTTWFTITMDSS